MKCNFILPNGDTCGAELKSRGKYKNNPDCEKCTCAAGHKRTLRKTEGDIVQGRSGRRAGAMPPMVKVDVRVSEARRAEIVAEFGSVTEFWNSALTAWIDGSNIVSRNQHIQ